MDKTLTLQAGSSVSFLFDSRAIFGRFFYPIELPPRLALRAESGNVASAVKYAQNARAERQRIAEEEAVRAKKRREYGKTKSGNWVNLG